MDHGKLFAEDEPCIIHEDFEAEGRCLTETSFDHQKCAGSDKRLVHNGGSQPMPHEGQVARTFQQCYQQEHVCMTLHSWDG